MAWRSSWCTSSTDLFGTWAPAVAALPPPPSFSSTTCTFTSPMLRAERITRPSWSGNRTKEVSTPEMLSSSSAAWAAVTRPTV